MVAACADIEAMFMPNSVLPSGRRFLQYRWYNEVHEDNRHTFGVSPRDSPCAACYTARQCAEYKKTAFPDAPNLVT